MDKYEFNIKVEQIKKLVNRGDYATAMKIADTGMDLKSAQIYLRCVRSMLRGERYTGTVNELAVSHYLTAIMSDYGFDGLRKALEALRLHLEYQSPYQTLAGLRKIYDEFLDVLP